MHTKRFEISLEHARFDPSSSMELKARVQTDHANHGVTQRFSKEGEVGSTWVDNGRDYTPEQREAVNRLFLHFYPIMRSQAIDWLHSHNFNPDTDSVSVSLDLLGVTHMSYDTD